MNVLVAIVISIIACYNLCTQLPAKLEQFGAAAISVFVNRNTVMGLQIVVMAVMRLDVRVSHH